ncbi:hypothetical protein NHQ30_011693 [Ciborinia camelliae]|nr:hypothetical protein NHQ30_011693 [Ciborinia camelliae]
MPKWDENLEYDDEGESSEYIAKNKPRALSLHVDFQRYVVWHWVIHTQAQNELSVSQISSMKIRLVKFLGSPTRSCVWYKSWVMRLYYPKPPTSALSNYDICDRILPSDFAMLLVCRLGIYTALGDQWGYLDRCLEQVNSLGLGLVELAVEADCYLICNRLLDAGASVDKRVQGSSIFKAIYSRNLKLVQLLHEKNRCHWDWLIQYDAFKYVLYDSFSSGDYEIVQYLSSDKRLDLNMYVDHSGSLLDASVSSAEPRMVELLIDRGSHVNLAHEHGKYGSILANAAFRGNLSMVKCPIRRGAEMNFPLKFGEYGSVLAAAAISFDRNLDLIEYLVGCSDDINVPLKCGKYGSVLAAAAMSRNSLDTVKYIVESDDVNLPLNCGIYGNALAAAIDSSESNQQTIQYFLHCGADVNLLLKYGNYGSALAIAVGPTVPTQLGLSRTDGTYSTKVYIISMYFLIVKLRPQDHSLV